MRTATLNHPKLVASLRRAYSAEMAASLAYQGHAISLRDDGEIARVRKIEQDEWDHRAHVLAIMRQYGVPISRRFELMYRVIGTVIAIGCQLIGRFMPFFFAGKLESGNVCEYFVMIRYFHELGITEHDASLYEMGMTEKEHEVYFANMVKDEKWLPWFEKVFGWGRDHSANDVDLGDVKPVEEAGSYCSGRHV